MTQQAGLPLAHAVLTSTKNAWLHTMSELHICSSHVWTTFMTSGYDVQ